MDEQPKKESTAGKVLKLLLKIGISIACLWYVSSKVDLGQAWSLIETSDWLFLLLALIAFVLSKYISALRLNINFHNVGVPLKKWENIKLYWLGMFYNLFLPGSITGDAYKVILLKKRYNAPYKKTTAAVILDRFSGLLGLGLILAVYSVMVLDELIYILIVVAGALMAIAASYYIVSRWMKDFRHGFFQTLLLGVLVQAAQVICVYLIMRSLGLTSDLTEYVFLFLLSSIVSVLPLTIGGLGIRELVFLEGGVYFGLLQETAVVISLLFYLITLFTSAWGSLYVFKEPLAQKK